MYSFHRGTDFGVEEHLNGAIPLGPIPWLGTFTLAAKTLELLSPVVATVTLPAGNVTWQLLLAQLLLAVPDLQYKITNHYAHGGYLSVRHETGLSFGATGTANALLGLSTTDTTTGAPKTADQIEGFTVASTPGSYVLLLRS